MGAISGLFYRDTNRTVSKAQIKAMTDVLQHRGPNGEMQYTEANAGLGMRGWTDEWSDDPREFRMCFSTKRHGDIFVLLDGEIYNAPELREKLDDADWECQTEFDAEVLAGLYDLYGLDQMFPMLRGKFAIAIWEPKTQTLTLARDPMGQKPIYLYQDAEKLVFASEIKGILACENIRKEINPTAIEDFFILGAVYGERSIYTDIQKVPAATWVSYRPSGSPVPDVKKTYWKFRINTRDDFTLDEWKERILNELTETVRMMKRDTYGGGAFLSGGLDSSIVVALQTRWGCDSIPTFSIGFKESQFNELEFAHEISDRFGTDWNEEIVEPDAVTELNNLVECFDEPYSDPSALPSLLVARLASRHVGCVFSGDGGDECFAGYARQIHDLKEDAVRRMFPEFFRKLVFGSLSHIYPKLASFPRIFRLKNAFRNLSMSAAEAYANTLSFCRNPLRRRLLRPLMQLPNYVPSDIDAKRIEAFNLAPKGDTLAGMQMAEMLTGLCEAMVKVDRTTMSFGVEVRSPFLDTKILQLASELPSHFKIEDGMGKWILRQIFEPQFPQKVKSRPKQGFELPTDPWLRGPLAKVFDEEVLAKGSKISTWVDTAVARQLFYEHKNKRGNYGGILWALLILAKWMQRWN